MDQKLIILFYSLNMLLVYGLITPDGEFEDRNNYIKFEAPHKGLDISSNLEETHGNPIKFTDDITKNDKENILKDPNTKHTNNNIESDNNLVKFEDNKEQQNIANESNNLVKKPRRKRKRRPRQQAVNGNVGFVSQGIPEGQNYFGAERPKRRKRLPRKPSLMQQTSSTFINTLTAISLYDDQQCIPKLLCDTTAGRKGGFSGGSMLQGFLDLQPLMTLLLAYNSATASPLFSFGRAIIIGMSSTNHNPYICQKSYPLCPSDPEKLVHYLNNHNGGFFRFFNNPNLNINNLSNNINNPSNNINNPNYNINNPNNINDPNSNQQQSLNQFLGHLSNAPLSFDQNLYNPQKYGLQNNFNQFVYPTNLLLNQPHLHPLNPYQIQTAYGSLQSQNHLNSYKNVKGDSVKESNEKSNIKSRNNANDLTQDDCDINNKLLSKNNDTNPNNYLDNTMNINRRILTKSPEENDDEDEEDEQGKDSEPIEAFEDIPKWLLPDKDENILKEANDKKRKMKTLLFPDEINILTNNDDLNIHKPFAVYRPPLNTNNDNNKKGFIFPDNSRYNNDQDINRFKMNKYVKIENNVHVKYESNNINSNINDGEFETVYVVRGNGDPNHPEIVKIRPGTRL